MLPHHQLAELQPAESFRSLVIDEEYPFVPLLNQDWKLSDKRILFVIETVDSCDLKDIKGKAKQLLRSVIARDKHDNKSEANTMRVTLTNLLNLSWREYKRWDSTADDTTYSIGVVNFNATRFLGLRGNPRATAETKCVTRLRTIIGKLKPTHVVFMGDTISHYFFPKDPAIFVKRGCVIPTEIDGWNTLVTPTLDLESLYSGKAKSDDEDDEEDDASDKSAAGDLLYFMSRNIANAFAGRHLYGLKRIVPNPILVDTLDKFKEMFALLKEHKVWAFDSETQNLESYNNKIHIAQFAVTSKEGYVLPLWHPKTPFNAEELKYIANRLRSLFGTTKPEMRKRIVVLNGAFDFRVFRAQLGIPVIYHHIWDVTAGEALLDENTGLFDRMRFFASEKPIKTPYGNLRNLFTHYGNDYYYTADFSKEERDTLGMVDILNHKGAQNYCAMDCQSIIAVYYKQLKRASLIKVRLTAESKPVSYLPMYETHVANQMSNTCHAISHMGQNGSNVDMDYLMYLLSDNSPLIKHRDEIEKEFLELPQVQEANAKLLSQNKMSTSSLFKKKVNVFEVNKPAHKQLLFFDVMGLEPVSFTKTKANAVDKTFYQAYKDDYQEVSLLETWGKISKLLGTYVKGWYSKIQESKDGKKDGHIRPGFGFFSIVTGRLNSFKPSLQQVPSRGKLSKYIKRMFRAPKGYLGIKWDFSAHEVRFWGIMAHDDKVAEAFKAGQALRKRLIKNPTDDLRKELKKKGDVHIQNIFLIFNRWVEKSDPLRDAIKAIVFGLIYGKGAKTLSKDIRNNELAGVRDKLFAAKSKVRELELKGDKEELAKAKSELKELQKQEASILAQDPKKALQDAEAIMDKLFGIFKRGKAFLDNCVEQVNSSGYIISPLGRRRNLYRVFTGKQGMIAAAERRAKNSPVQGIASEVGATCAYLVLLESHKYMLDNDVDMSLFPVLCRAVHDCNVYEIPYEMLIPLVHIMQYVATYGVTKYYKDVFGFEFNVEPEIELEISATEDASKKWNWELPSLVADVQNCLKEQVTLGDLTEEEVIPTMQVIFTPWRSKTLRTYLQDNYPLLNVADLHDEIKAAIKPLYV